MLRTKSVCIVATVLLLTIVSPRLVLAAPVDLTNANYDDRVRQRPEDTWMVFELFASW